MAVDADNDLSARMNRITIDVLRWYGKLLELLKEIDQCIGLLDGAYPDWLYEGGGIVFDNFNGALCR